MAAADSVTTIGSLLSKDIKEGYLLLSYPSTYCQDYWLRNDEKYQKFDYPPPPASYYKSYTVFRNLPAAGDQLPVLLFEKPPVFLVNHWKKWLPAFPTPVLKNFKEGLGNDTPIVTEQACQSIPKAKHSVDPDILYKLQLKSTIPEIGVPCPRHFDKENISYPCLVKVDQSHGGMGHRLSKDENELSQILTEITEDLKWKGGIVLQEFIQDIQKIQSFAFYLQKSGEIVRIGTLVGCIKSFAWKSATADWSKQQYYYNLEYEELIKPIANFLHRKGYFGVADFEVIFTKDKKYVVDLNVRVCGDTSHLLIAKYMAEVMSLNHSYLYSNTTRKTTASSLVKTAEEINASFHNGIIIIMSIAEENAECRFSLSIFAKTRDDINILRDKLEHAF